MKPVRMTLAEVHARYEAGTPVPEHEAQAAFDWLWLRSEFGSAAPPALPLLPGVSESGRAVFALLGDVVNCRGTAPDVVGALCERLGWRDAPCFGSRMSSWRWLARQWLVPPLMELVERKVISVSKEGHVRLRREWK